MRSSEGKWVTINGAHIFIPKGKKPSEVLKGKKDIVVYRAGTSEGQTESGTFLTSDKSEASNYGKPKKYIIDKSSKIFEGNDTREYAKENKLMNKKSNKLKEKLGVETLKEVKDIYENWITPSYLDENPNLYFFAFQYMAKEDLNKKGFDGAHWKIEDDLTPEQYQIWNNKIMKK